jgi:uncharacterized membrane protein
MADQMDEKLAGTLCYALGWVTGIIFIMIDKRPKVRFHAAQSIIVFGGLQIISMILGGLFSGGPIFGLWDVGPLGGLLLRAFEIAVTVLWVLFLVKTYQGEKFKVPGAAEIAEGLANKA